MKLVLIAIYLTDNFMDLSSVKNNKILYLLFYLTIQFIILNNISVYSFEGRDFAIKMHHICAMLLFAYGFSKGSLPKISWPITLFLGTISITSLISYAIYSFNIQYINLLYCIALVIIFSLAAMRIPYEMALKIMRIAFTVSFVAVIVKDIILFDQIQSLMSRGYRVVIYGLVAGGPNQEGSILALGAIFFVRRKSFFIYLLAVIALNTLYNSRGGIIVCVIILMIHLFKGERKNLLLTIGGAFIFSALLALVMTFSSDSLPIDRMIERFTSIGSDRGSLGRFILWNGAWVAFQNNVFGYGMMNAVPMIETLNNIELLENNLHNIYFQLIIDGGLHTIIVYLIMVFWVVRKTIANGSNNYFGLFLIVYFMVGALRFRAYDPFAFMMLGLFQMYLMRYQLTKDRQ